jgi:hypothetical protein
VCVIEMPFSVVVGCNMSVPRRDGMVQLSASALHMLRVGTRYGLGCDHGTHKQVKVLSASPLNLTGGIYLCFE